MTSRIIPPRWYRFATAIRAVFLWAGEWIIIGLMFFGLALMMVFASFFFDALGQSPTSCGTASFYADAHHGKITASGEVFNMRHLTAAHPYHLFGTVLRVTRQDTGASVVVRVNDRGPAIPGRIIDLSRAAALVLDMERQGLATVCLEVVERPA